MDRSRLGIVIPALNEAGTIAPVVEKASAFGTVIVVDDGSTDETGEVARQAGAEVVRHDGNKGYDAALSSGFARADELGFDAAVSLDADGEHDPQILADFAAKLEKAPLVLGVRPRKQRVAEVVMGIYFKVRFGVEDILCGMKGYSMELYRENGGFDHVGSVGTELALNSIKRGHAFVQVPVKGRSRQGRPRFGSLIKGNWRIFKALFRVIGIDVKIRLN